MCVLLVDDEPVLLEIVAEFLLDQGFDVITADGARQAFDLIDHPPRRFSVLVTDLNMPGPHNGCDVADRMTSRHPHVHVLVVTGRPDLIETECSPDRHYAVIPKPFNLPDIARHLAALWRRGLPSRLLKKVGAGAQRPLFLFG